MLPGIRTARRICLRGYLEKLFAETGGNLSRAEKIAGVDRSSIQRWVRKLGMQETLRQIRKRTALEKLAELRR